MDLNENTKSTFVQLKSDGRNGLANWKQVLSIPCVLDGENIKTGVLITLNGREIRANTSFTILKRKVYSTLSFLKSD